MLIQGFFPACLLDFYSLSFTSSLFLCDCKSQNFLEFPGDKIFFVRKSSVLLVVTGSWFNRVICKTNPKCLPETYYLPYGLTSICLKQNPLICSSHWYLHSLPHPAPSAWTTCLKPLYCPLTISKCKQWTHSCFTPKEDNFLSYKHSKK